MRHASLVVAVVVSVLVLGVTRPADAAGTARTAALQVALRAEGYYGDRIDGVLGPRTRRALRRFQRDAGVVVDGHLGPQTRRALGSLGRPSFGSRALRSGLQGWDASELQFELARHGFPTLVDAVFGWRTEAAVRRFQRYAGEVVDGIVGPATFAALHRARSGPMDDSLGARAVALAHRYLGVPYVWGGLSPSVGFDCSGLVAFVYGRLGVWLPHSSSLQFEAGRRIKRADLRPGDLVFMELRGGRPRHNGIYDGGGWLIEAPHTGDVVRISRLADRIRHLGYVGAVRPY
jgi:peptidoglycan DL-endopeptidase CwlO